MFCFIYKSLKKDALYLYIEKKDDFSSVPKMLLDTMGKPVFVMGLELSPKRKLAREDTQQVIQQLRDKGFFVQLPPSTITLFDKFQD